MIEEINEAKNNLFSLRIINQKSFHFPATLDVKPGVIYVQVSSLFKI